MYKYLCVLKSDCRLPLTSKPAHVSAHGVEVLPTVSCEKYGCPFSSKSRTSKPDIMPAASSIRWGIESRITLLLIFTSTCQFVLVVCQSHPRTLAQLGTAFLNLISRVILCSSVRRKLCIKHLSMFSTCVALCISSTCLSYLPSCANSGVASSSVRGQPFFNCIRGSVFSLFWHWQISHYSILIRMLSVDVEIDVCNIGVLLSMTSVAVSLLVIQ